MPGEPQTEARCSLEFEPAMPARLHDLKGLAATWEAEEVVRRRLLWDGLICKWPAPEAIGVASYSAAALNYETLKPFFESWVSVCATSPKTPSLPVIKLQAGNLDSSQLDFILRNHAI